MDLAYSALSESLAAASRLADRAALSFSRSPMGMASTMRSISLADWARSLTCPRYWSREGNSSASTGPAWPDATWAAIALRAASASR